MKSNTPNRLHKTAQAAAVVAICLLLSGCSFIDVPFVPGI